MGGRGGGRREGGRREGRGGEGGGGRGEKMGAWETTSTEMTTYDFPVSLYLFAERLVWKCTIPWFKVS